MLWKCECTVEGPELNKCGGKPPVMWKEREKKKQLGRTKVGVGPKGP